MVTNTFLEVINPMQDGPFRGCSRMGGGFGRQKGPVSLKSVTDILQL